MNKYQILLFSFSLISTSIGLTQVPVIEWQKCSGGSSSEGGPLNTEETNDGGYITIGLTTSNDGEVTNYQSDGDAWITKLNSSGSLEWQKCLGGSADESFTHWTETTDNGYLLLGTTSSIDGIINNGHGSYDAWVVKLDALGNVMWQKCFGGSDLDVLTYSISTNDNGFILVGYTLSNDGDVSGNHGGKDLWVLKIDALGNLEWQKCFGGSHTDGTFSQSFATSNNGFILIGNSSSNDGDVSGNHGGSDVWVLEIDNAANLLWQKCFGGTYDEDVEQILANQNESTLILTALTNSNDGNVFGYHGVAGGVPDIWVLKIDYTGNLIWQKPFGGTGRESIRSIQLLNNNEYIFNSWTESIDGDINGNHGMYDAWVVKIDGQSNIIWQKCLGGSYGDYLYSMLPLSDGSFLLSGTVDSNDGDVTNNHGENDAWVVKIDGQSNIIWQKCFGGSLFDYLAISGVTSDNSVIFYGFTNSNDGDVIGHHGGGDWWVVKMSGNITSNGELDPIDKVLVKVINLLGQEVEYTPNTLLIYQYSNGTTEKVFTAEK